MDQMDPLTKLEAFAAKWAVYIICFVIILLTIIGWLWWNAHMNAKNAAALPKAQAIVNKAEASAGGAAINTVTTNAKTNTDTDKKTTQVTNVYNSYPAAKAAIDPGFIDAFNRGICMYKSATNLPQCVGLRQSDTK